MKIGLALAGGGVKGVAHVGVLKALLEEGIEIGYLGGASSGSMVATLYAMGYTPEDMMKLFTYFIDDVVKIDPRFLVSSATSNKQIFAEGFSSGKNIEVIMEECAAYKGFKFVKDIEIPIVIPTVDVNEKKEYVFTNRENSTKFPKEKYITDATISNAVRASTSYPIMYAPAKYKGHRFVDGGVMDNIPVENVKKLGAKKVLAVGFQDNDTDDPKNLFEVASTCLDILYSAKSTSLYEKADYELRVPLPGVSVFSTKKLQFAYRQGYDEAKKHMKAIKKALEL